MKRKVRTRKLGIKFKILIPVCVCVLVVCVVMGVNSYKHIQDGMVEMGVQEADMAADLTLRMLDGDEVEGASFAVSGKARDLKLAATRWSRSFRGQKKAMHIKESWQP